jgi:hypothetical protein
MFVYIGKSDKKAEVDASGIFGEYYYDFIPESNAMHYVLQLADRGYIETRRIYGTIYITVRSDTQRCFELNKKYFLVLSPRNAEHLDYVMPADKTVPERYHYQHGACSADTWKRHSIQEAPYVSPYRYYNYDKYEKLLRDVADYEYDKEMERKFEQEQADRDLLALYGAYVSDSDQPADETRGAGKDPAADVAEDTAEDIPEYDEFNVKNIVLKGAKTANYKPL